MIRKIIVISTGCILLCAAATAQAQTKVDPFLHALTPVKAFKAASLSASQAPRGTAAEAPRPIDVFIKSGDTDATAAAIESAGGAVHTIVGEVLTATIDAALVDAIAEGREVVFVEVGKPVQMKNDVALADIKAAAVHAGDNLSAAVTGKGVIVGVIDTGIDYRHPDFLDGEGNSRILAIWDQNRSSGPAPAEIANSFGTECQASSIADGSCPLRDFDGHGTHVSGTIAGRNSTYGGVAPDANIIVVTYDSSLDLESGYADTIFSTKICQAAYYVFAKAAGLGMPAVVNLSLGTHLGAHDGTSLFEECLEGLLQGSAGRAIVAAAGNEYSSDTTYTGIHAGFDVSELSATNFVIRQASRDRLYYIDIWGAPGSELSFGLAFRNGQPPTKISEDSGLAAPGEVKNGTFLSGGIEWMINATETASNLNGKPHVGIRIVLGPEVTTPSKYSFDLVVEGTGSFDAWIFPDKPAKTVQFTSVAGRQGADWDFVPGDRVKSVAIPATSPEVIAVAGYTTRNRWDSAVMPNCCMVAYEAGDLLDFSSSGPSADAQATGQKPEIAAPGGMIASALSQDAQPNGALLMDDMEHVLQAGTSMAAPFVTGTIALMFSANPNFTHADAKHYITESAAADAGMGQVPNDRWGFGKLDAYAAFSTAIAGGASGNFDANGNLSSPPSDGSGGGSGCALSPAAAPEGLQAVLGMFGFVAIVMRCARRRQCDSPMIR